MQSLLKTLSENVRFYRKKSGLSQLKLAYQIDMSPSYLNDVENARQYISLKMLERLAEFFKIEPYRLLLPLDFDSKSSASAEYENELRILQSQINKLFDSRLGTKTFVAQNSESSSEWHFCEFKPTFYSSNFFAHFSIFFVSFKCFA